MNHLKTHLLLATASIAPASALMMAWLGNQWFDTDHWLLRLSLLTIALVVAGVCASIIMARASRGQLAAQHSLDLLSRRKTADLRDWDPQKSAEGLPAGSPWYDILTRLQNRIVEQGERLHALEMKQAALEVRAHRKTTEQQRIAGILDNLSDPVLAVDEYDELILANSSARELFAFQCDPEERQLLDNLVECQKLVDLLKEARRRKHSNRRVGEVQLDDSNGNPRWYQITARNLNGATDVESDAPAAAVAVLRDISSHKEIQKRNAEFVSSVSHEMKTPLACIKAYVELLADGEAEDDETRDEFLEVINGQANRLQRLVENLLNIARIEAGVVKVSKVQHSLNELLEEVVGMMQPVAEEKQIQLLTDLSPMYLGVLADRDLLIQAAINLLSNAIKYTAAGRKVTVRSHLVGNHAEWEVEDEGVGLDEEDQVRIFDKFYRVKKDKSMAGGTGLGLPLARHIVEDVHRGRLTVTSQLDVGSTFTVQLPSAGQIMTKTNNETS